MPQCPSLDRIHEIFVAYSEPTRIRILHLLKEKETCVGDLEAILDIPQSKVSRHLTVLKNSGFIDCRKDSRWCYYSLAEAETPFHQQLLDGLANCFCEVPEIQTDQQRAKKLRKSGGCCPIKGMTK